MPSFICHPAEFCAYSVAAERIQLVFDDHLGRISKADIARQCPGISISMIEQTLKSLLDAGVIAKIGKGRNTAYVKR